MKSLIAQNSLFLILILVVSSCTSNMTVEEYFQSELEKKYSRDWVGNLIKIKALMLNNTLNEIKRNINYQSYSKKDIQNALNNKQLNNEITFQLRIDPKDKFVDSVHFHNSDILFGFGMDKSSRDKKINKFNFNLNETLWLLIDDKRIYPTLSHLERNFGVDNGRDVWIKFNLSDSEIKKLRKDNNVKLVWDIPHRGETISEFNWKL